MATTNKPPAPSLSHRIWDSVVPVTVLLAVFIVIWYGAAWAMNSSAAVERVLTPTGNPFTWQDVLSTALNMERPVMPAPHQIAVDFWSSLVDWPVDSPRNLLFHVAVTGETTLLGFVLGTLMGLVLSIAIVHSRTLDRALLPWIVASQTVPVLAIAPIVLVILGSMGMEGLAPKAVIAMYLSFFPVTVAMVQGLRSPQVIETEMLHTYAASRWQALWMLRLPAALPFLFPALRVGIAASLVGAMVAELPTGAQDGLGARLLTGSYYGNTLAIWSALVMSALLGLLLTTLVAATEHLALRHRRQP